MGWRSVLLVLGVGVIVPTLGTAQVAVSSWTTEISAGAASDLFSRGPWINTTWRRSWTARVGLATGLSLFYEYAVEPWNGQTNAGRWPDVAQRLVGTLATEAALWAARKVF